LEESGELFNYLKSIGRIILLSNTNFVVVVWRDVMIVYLEKERGAGIALLCYTGLFYRAGGAAKQL
jgi:hypothetical protein